MYVVLYLLSSCRIWQNKMFNQSKLESAENAVQTSNRVTLSWIKYTQVNTSSVCCFQYIRRMGLDSLNNKTSYHKISLRLQVTELGVKMIVSLWNWISTWAAVTPGKFLQWLDTFICILRLRDFTRDFPKFSGSVSPLSIGYILSTELCYKADILQTAG